MALNTFKCNCLTPLHFKGLNHRYCVSVENCAFMSLFLVSVVDILSIYYMIIFIISLSQLSVAFNDACLIVLLLRCSSSISDESLN